MGNHQRARELVYTCYESLDNDTVFHYLTVFQNYLEDDLFRQPVQAYLATLEEKGDRYKIMERFIEDLNWGRDEIFWAKY